MADSAIITRSLSLWYGTFQALFDVDLDIEKGRITSMIGPSGCGKSTLLRCINRINERLGYVRTEGSVHVLGHDIYAPGVELIQVASRPVVNRRPELHDGAGVADTMVIVVGRLPIWPGCAP